MKFHRTSSKAFNRKEMPMAETASLCDFGWKAPTFRLPATDGKDYTLDDVRGPKGALVLFICNHCPYVKAVLDQIVRDARELRALGIGSVAISSNDTENYPEDSFANMRLLVERMAFPFPYLYDESQEVARAYGAVCTPDVFGLDAGLHLQYRGRVNASRNAPAPPGTRREMFEAMRLIADTGLGPREQHPSMGCSIKWKAS